MIRTIASIGCAALALASSHAHADSVTPRCFDLQRLWIGRYASDFHVSWRPSKFFCPGSTGALALAMYDLETSTFRPTPKGYKPDFYDIVTRVIRTTSYNSTCKSLATGRRSTGTMTICPKFFSDQREDRASTLVHESRHLQQGDPGHVSCVGGKHAGDSGACDADFYNGSWKGSGYNSDVFFMNWQYKASVRNELSRSVLKSYLNSFIPDRFNNVTPEQIAQWRAL